MTHFIRIPSRMKILLPIALIFSIAAASAQSDDPNASARSTEDRLREYENRLTDWPQLAVYRESNARLGAPAPGKARVIFFGDSVTEGWERRAGSFFPGNAYINRGIHGQTTAQMLVRFRADVIALKPRVVLILGGTNDLAGKTGPSSPAMIEDNLASMTELAQANGIRVVLASLLPVNDYVEPRTTHRSPQKITELNAWIKTYALRRNAIYLDYFSAMVDSAGTLKKEWSDDGLHPNAAGYAVMTPLAQKAIEQALARELFPVHRDAE